jgi:outer membrane receptor protein involved in Fe transport
LAPAAFGQFVDLSMIPLTAIERVEVLTDGASATYGSDAVGGVINLILNEHYDGAETVLKAGSVTEGDMEEYQASQTLGYESDRAHGLLTYEYYERSELDANDREFSEPAADPYHLLQEQDRHSLFGSAGVDLGERTHLSGLALFSERQAERVSVNTFTLEPTTEPTETRQLSVALSAARDVADTWQAELTGLYGRNDTHRDVVTATSSTPAERNELELTSAEFKADGTLFAMRGGPARLAMGGAWRDERFESHTPDGFKSDRTVLSAYAEVSVPVLKQLEVSLAGRYEDYSDFGGTTNPKIGIAWSPAKAVTFRGTYGTSFRAPILTELDDSNASGVLIQLADPTVPDGTTLIMLASGNDRDLQPEEATTWTAGVDLVAGSSRSFKVHATYFDTEYEDRITELLPGLEILGVFNQADVFAPIIDRTPDVAEVARLAALPFFFNLYGPFVPEDVEAIVDRRRQNISATTVRGVDLAALYTLDSGVGQWSFQLDSTYFFEFANQVTAAAPSDEVLDTAYHPIDLRARASISWSRDAWSSSLFINYADGYVNDTASPVADVASWATVDLQLAYEINAATGWLDGWRVALSAQNILDEDPPFVSSPVAQIALGFDPTNASPVGRFLSLTATLRW